MKKEAAVTSSLCLIPCSSRARLGMTGMGTSKTHRSVLWVHTWSRRVFSQLFPPPLLGSWEKREANQEVAPGLGSILLSPVGAPLQSPQQAWDGDEVAWPPCHRDAVRLALGHQHVLTEGRPSPSVSAHFLVPSLELQDVGEQLAQGHQHSTAQGCPQQGR